MNTLIKIIFVCSSVALYAQEIKKTYNLQECIDYAFEHNISIQKQALQVESTENTMQRTYGNFLPRATVGLSQSANIYHQPKAQVNSFSTQFNFIQADWTIFNGFRNLNAYEQSKLDHSMAKKNWEMLQNDMALQIANTYLQVLFGQALVEVAESQLFLSQTQLDIVNKQFAGDVVPLASVADAEAAVAQDELTLVQRQNSVQSALLQLKTLLQMPLDNPIEVEDIRPEDYMLQLELMAPSEVYNQALTMRPEIELRKLGIERAQRDIEVSKGGFLPMVSLGYGFGTGYTVLKDVPVDNFGQQFSNNLGHSFSLSIRVPLFEGYQNKVNLANAKISMDNAELDLENEKFQLKQRIESAYLEAHNARKMYEASLKNVEARSIALDFTQKRYEAGTVNILDFETAKNNWIAAKGNLIQAKYDFLFKVKVLHFYTNNQFNIN